MLDHEHLAAVVLAIEELHLTVHVGLKDVTNLRFLQSVKAVVGVLTLIVLVAVHPDKQRVVLVVVLAARHGSSVCWQQRVSQCVAYARVWQQLERLQGPFRQSPALAFIGCRL